MTRGLSRRAFLTGRPAAKREAGVATLSREACIAWNGVVCMSCKTACDEQAIVLDERGRPTVIDTSCTGCDACVPVCPTAAIRID